VPRSMTGYGAGEAEGTLGRARSELRGVNARFLEVRARIPQSLAPFEADFRRRIGEAFLRGRIDLTLSWEASEGAPSPFGLNADAVRAYLEVAKRLREEFGLEGRLEIVETLALPGVVEIDRPEVATSGMRDLALEAIGAALREMDAMRRAEGEATALDIAARLDAIAGLREQILARAEAVPMNAKKKLQERLARLGLDDGLDPARLAQEVAFLADRADIAEELARLSAHLERARETLSRQDEPVGKTLEFLAQELHRETNTIGSKTSDAEISGWVLQMKTEIERIREQVQNLE